MNIVKQIPNLKEKELLVAHYFCGKQKKDFTPEELFDMWSNWFKQDFRINGKPIFKVVNDELVYRKNSKMSDKGILRQYNHIFHNIYKWIKHTLEIESHDKIFFKEELRKERNRQYGRVIGVAKPLGIYIAMNTSFIQLAEFKLMRSDDRSRIVTSGNADKMIEYLNKMKRESA